MRDKRGSGWTVSKLITLILSIIILALIVVGITSHGLDPMFKRLGEYADNALASIGLARDRANQATFSGNCFEWSDIADNAALTGAQFRVCAGYCELDNGGKPFDPGKDYIYRYSISTKEVELSDRNNPEDKKEYISNYLKDNEQLEEDLKLRKVFLRLSHPSNTPPEGSICLVGGSGIIECTYEGKYYNLITEAGSQDYTGGLCEKDKGIDELGFTSINEKKRINACVDNSWPKKGIKPLTKMEHPLIYTLDEDAINLLREIQTYFTTNCKEISSLH